MISHHDKDIFYWIDYTWKSIPEVRNTCMVFTKQEFQYSINALKRAGLIECEKFDSVWCIRRKEKNNESEENKNHWLLKTIAAYKLMPFVHDDNKLILKLEEDTYKIDIEDYNTNRSINIITIESFHIKLLKSKVKLTITEYDELIKLMIRRYFYTYWQYQYLSPFSRICEIPFLKTLSIPEHLNNLNPDVVLYSDYQRFVIIIQIGLCNSNKEAVLKFNNCLLLKLYLSRFSVECHILTLVDNFDLKFFRQLFELPFPDNDFKEPNLIDPLLYYDDTAAEHINNLFIEHCFTGIMKVDNIQRMSNEFVEEERKFNEFDSYDSE